MKINKYCKFLIYLWSDLVFGSAIVLCTLFLLMPILAASFGHVEDSNKPASVVWLPLTEIVSGGISFLILMVAVSIWIVPTLFLLLFGAIAAPKEEEDTSGMGKQAFLIAFAICIGAGGLLMFLSTAPLDDSKITSLVLLAITFIIVIAIFSLALGKKGEVQEIEPLPQPQENRGYAANETMYCEHCGKKKTSSDASFCKYCGNKL